MGREHEHSADFSPRFNWHQDGEQREDNCHSIVPLPNRNAYRSAGRGDTHAGIALHAGWDALISDAMISAIVPAMTASRGPRRQATVQRFRADPLASWACPCSRRAGALRSLSRDAPQAGPQEGAPGRPVTGPGQLPAVNPTRYPQRQTGMHDTALPDASREPRLDAWITGLASVTLYGHEA
jgi:hypothetical protein